MTSLNMFDLIPKWVIGPLKALGNYEWLRWSPVDSNPPSSRFTLAIPDVPSLRPHRLFIDKLRSLGQADSLGVCLYARSKWLANGPKLVRPTSDQCEALEHVDVSVTFDEYEQPFPVFLVELPHQYRRILSSRFNHECPKAVMVCHDRRTQYLFSICEYGPTKESTFSIMSPRPYWSTIEDALRLCVEPEGDDLRIGEVLYRVAINFGLLLTGYGFIDKGPLDPVSHRKLSRNAKKSNDRKAQRAKELLDATINLVSLKQEVVFHDSRQQGEANPDADGRKKLPHWRRGHFRMQAWGAGHAKHRLTFIKPTLINAGYFRGDVADTTYRISIPSPTSDHAPITC